MELFVESKLHFALESKLNTNLNTTLGSGKVFHACVEFHAKMLQIQEYCCLVPNPVFKKLHSDKENLEYIPLTKNHRST